MWATSIHRKDRIYIHTSYGSSCGAGRPEASILLAVPNEVDLSCREAWVFDERCALLVAG